MVEVSAEERKGILQQRINQRTREGWRVQSQTDYTAQLVKNKSPNCLVTIILFLFLLIPGILYLLLYKGEMGLYIEVDHNGKLRETRRG